MGDQTSRMMMKTVGRDNVELRYEVVGPSDGIPLVLTPGGQNGVEHGDNRKLAQRLAKELGFRCLLHDRVNNGGSSIFLGRERSKADSAEEAESPEYRGHGEPPMQAFFLRLLMKELGMLPAYFWGNSSGARMSLFFASMFPDDVKGLVLVNITGGPKAAKQLSESYHLKYAQTCRRDGMEAVMQQGLFQDMIKLRPANEGLLRAMPPAEFIAAEESWAAFLAARDGHPIVGISSEILSSIKHPAFCINNYGEKNDGLHTPAAIRALAKHLGNCTKCVVETKKAVWVQQAFLFLRSLIQNNERPGKQAGFDGSNVVETAKFVFFWQPPGVFSQWTESEFVVDGVSYDCGEMYMMAEKARLFGDEETLKKILAARGDPKTIKALGRQVRPFDEKRWQERSLEVVIAGNLAKFSQNPRMRQQLLATGSKTLAEASPLDTIWGIGLRADDPACCDPSKWKGANQLGNALMVVREKLRALEGGAGGGGGGGAEEEEKWGRVAGWHRVERIGWWSMLRQQAGGRERQEERSW